MYPCVIYVHVYKSVCKRNMCITLYIKNISGSLIASSGNMTISGKDEIDLGKRPMCMYSLNTDSVTVVYICVPNLL